MPVTALLGPRQCGKTTAAKMLLNNNPDFMYLDLENQEDIRQLSDPQAFFRLYRDRLICIDEIQRYPELFPAMRSEVDTTERNGRFLVLGSASPDLLRQTSETLAGRVRYIEMTPFLLDEVGGGEDTLRKLWLRGGYPRSFLAADEESSFEWREDFIRTFLERDIPGLGFRVPHSNMRRFWTMLTHCNAQVLNRSKLGESIGVSHHTVQHHLDVLRDSYMVRILEPLEVNVRKRLVKSPKVYFRDTGLLHALAGIRTQRNLLSHPDYGSSWETFGLETICNQPKLRKKYRFFFYSVHSGGEIDLVLDNGSEKIAIEFKASSAPEIPRRFSAACREINTEQKWIIAPVNRMYPARDGLMIGSPMDFIRETTA